MSKLRRVDDALYVHFITFSCYHRRRLLDHDQPKRILLGILTDELLKFDARCIGFVIMPDHVHALIWFPKIGQLSRFMQQWKGRSSKAIKEFLYRSMPEYASKFSKTDPIWQVRFYSFEIYTTGKIEEKLNYMHLNPVRAGLVERPTQWRWGSARWYIEGRTVGIPIQWVDRCDATRKCLLFLRHPDAQSSVWATPPTNTTPWGDESAKPSAETPHPTPCSSTPENRSPPTTLLAPQLRHQPRNTCGAATLMNSSAGPPVAKCSTPTATNNTARLP